MGFKPAISDFRTGSFNHFIRAPSRRKDNRPTIAYLLDVTKEIFNPDKIAEIFLYKPWRPKAFFNLKAA